MRMLEVTFTALLNLMLIWPTSPYPIWETPSKLKTAEDCLEVDLQEVETLRSQILDQIDNSSIDHFGLREDDWIRLSSLEKLLPPDSPLKDKLVRTFRILIAAIETVHKKPSVNEDKNQLTYRQSEKKSDDSQDAMKTENNRISTLTEDSTEISSFPTLYNMNSSQFLDSSKISTDNYMYVSTTETDLFNLRKTSESTTKSTEFEVLNEYETTRGQSINRGSSSRKTATEGPDKLTYTMPKSNLNTEEKNNEPLSTVINNEDNTLKAVTTDYTKKQFREYTTPTIFNIATMNEEQYTSNWQNDIQRKNSILHNIIDVTDSTDTTGHSTANNIQKNTGTEIFTDREEMEDKNISVFVEVELDKSTSNYAISTTDRNLSFPVTSSQLVTTVSVSSTDKLLAGAITHTTMTPYDTDKEIHTIIEERSSTVSPQSSLVDNTVQSEELDNNNQLTVNTHHIKETESVSRDTEIVTESSTENETKSIKLSEGTEKGSVQNNTEVINKVDTNQNKWPVSANLGVLSSDYTWRDSTVYTDKVESETEPVSNTESLDVSGMSAISGDSKSPAGFESTHSEVTTSTTSLMTDNTYKTSTSSTVTDSVPVVSHEMSTTDGFQTDWLENSVTTETVPHSLQDTADLKYTYAYTPQSSTKSNKVYNMYEITEETSTNLQYSTVAHSQRNDNVSHVSEDSGSTRLPTTESNVLYPYKTSEIQTDIDGYTGTSYNASVADITNEANGAVLSTIQMDTDKSMEPHTEEDAEVQTVTGSNSNVMTFTTERVTVASVTSHQDNEFITKGSNQPVTQSSGTSETLGTYTSSDMDKFTTQRPLLNDITKPNIREESILPNGNSGQDSGAQIIATETVTRTEPAFTEMSDDIETSQSATTTESDVIVINTLSESVSVTDRTILSSELYTESSTSMVTVLGTLPVLASDVTVTVNNTDTTHVINTGYDSVETGPTRSLFEFYTTESVTQYYVDNDSNVPYDFHLGKISTSIDKHTSPLLPATEFEETTIAPTTETYGIETVPVSDKRPVNITRNETNEENKIKQFFIKLPQQMNLSVFKPTLVYNMTSIPTGNLMKPDVYNLTQQCVSSSPCLKVQHSEFVSGNLRPAGKEINHSLNTQQESQSNRNELMWWYKMRKLRKKSHNDNNLLNYLNKK